MSILISQFVLPCLSPSVSTHPFSMSTEPDSENSRNKFSEAQVRILPGQIGRLGLTYIYITWGFPGGSDSKESSCNAETWVCSLGQEDLLEKEMATHSSILSWRIPWTEEPGGLKSMGSKSQTRLSDYHTHTHSGT